MTKRIHELTLRAALATDELEVQGTVGGASARVTAQSLVGEVLGYTPTGVNKLSAAWGNSGIPVTLATVGSDTDIGLRLFPKGKGDVVFGDPNASMYVNTFGANAGQLVLIADEDNEQRFGSLVQIMASDSSACTTISMARSRGTLANPTAVGDGDCLGVFYAYGQGTTSGRLSAGFEFWAMGPFSDAGCPTEMRFCTADTTDSIAVDRMKLTQDGKLNIYGLTASQVVLTDASKNLVSGGAKPTITGSRGANAALASLLAGLAGLGIVTDSTT